MRQIGEILQRAAPALIALVALALAACAPPGTGPGTKMSSDCKSMLRQQQAMVAKGQQNTAQYRKVLDSYLQRCGR